MRNTWSLVPIAALAFVAAPLAAQELAPNSVWGEAPHAVSIRAASAVLFDSQGNAVATVRVSAGRFTFPNVAPGRYTVALQDAANQTLARSHPAELAGGATVRVHFADDVAAGTHAWEKPGFTTTRLVAGSAAALGCVGFIAYHHHPDHHHPPVSGSRLT